jgi:hypothetical protein
MKGITLTIIFILMMLILIIAAVEQQSNKRIELEQSTEQTDPRMQRNVVGMNSMEFYEDQTTGMCFATVWLGEERYGGPMMTQVDCELTNGGIPFWSTINENGD